MHKWYIKIGWLPNSFFHSFLVSSACAQNEPDEQNGWLRLCGFTGGCLLRISVMTNFEGAITRGFDLQFEIDEKPQQITNRPQEVGVGLPAENVFTPYRRHLYSGLNRLVIFFSLRGTSNTTWLTKWSLKPRIWMQKTQGSLFRLYFFLYFRGFYKKRLTRVWVADVINEICNFARYPTAVSKLVSCREFSYRHVIAIHWIYCLAYVVSCRTYQHRTIMHMQRDIAAEILRGFSAVGLMPFLVCSRLWNINFI